MDKLRHVKAESLARVFDALTQQMSELKVLRRAVAQAERNAQKAARPQDDAIFSDTRPPAIRRPISRPDRFN
jgi:hypothetical protein